MRTRPSLAKKSKRGLAGLAVAAVVGLLSPAPVLAAGDPVALITDYAGGKRAGVEAFSELSDGQTITLGAQDRLTVLHYRSCKSLTITGGTVHISRQAITQDGGSHEEAPGEACPQELTVATAGVGGGALVRAVGFSTVPATLEGCVIVGKKAAKISAVSVSQNDAPLFTAKVRGHRLELPAGQSLTEGADYSLGFLAGKTVLQSQTVSAIAGNPDSPCLIRVE